MLHIAMIGQEVLFDPMRLFGLLAPILEKTKIGLCSIPLAAAAEVLDSDPRNHVLLVFRRPEQALAEGIAQGMMPRTALAAWHGSVESGLRLLRSNRRRYTLIELEALLNAPYAACALLWSKLQPEADGVFDTDAGSGLVTGQDQSAPARPACRIADVFALQLLALSASARLLLAELEASALPTKAAPAYGLEDLDATFIAENAARTALEAATASALAEKRFLMEQLSQIQDVLETREADFDALDAAHRAVEAARISKLTEIKALRVELTEQNERLTAEVAAHREMFAGMERDLNDLRFRLTAQAQAREAAVEALGLRDGLLDEANRRRVALEIGFAEQQAMREADAETIAALTRDRDAAQAELDQVYRSHSWLVTAPMRSLRRGITPKS